MWDTHHGQHVTSHNNCVSYTVQLTFNVVYLTNILLSLLFLKIDCVTCKIKYCIAMAADKI